MDGWEEWVVRRVIEHHVKVDGVIVSFNVIFINTLSRRVPVLNSTYLSVFRWVLKEILDTLEVHSIFLGRVNILGMSDLRDLWRSHGEAQLTRCEQQ